MIDDQLKVWVIMDWDAKFETSRSRTVKELPWLQTSNRLDDHSILRLLENEHGLSDFGVWSLVCRLASKCTPRGTLYCPDTHQPHTGESIAFMLRADREAVVSAMDRLAEIGWIARVNLSDIDLSDSPNGSGRRVDERVVSALVALGVPVEEQHKMGAQVASMSRDFGGTTRLAELLMRAKESGCEDLNSARAFIRKTGWRRGDRAAVESDDGASSEIKRTESNT